MLSGFETLDGVLVLRIVQQGVPHEVVDQACNSFLIRIFFLIVGHEAIRIRGATLEGKGEDDLLFGRGSNIGRAVPCDLPENEPSLIILARL